MWISVMHSVVMWRMVNIYRTANESVSCVTSSVNFSITPKCGKNLRWEKNRRDGDLVDSFCEITMKHTASRLLLNFFFKLFFLWMMCMNNRVKINVIRNQSFESCSSLNHRANYFTIQLVTPLFFGRKVVHFFLLNQ